LIGHGGDFINPDHQFFSEIGVEISISRGVARGDSGLMTFGLPPCGSSVS